MSTVEQAIQEDAPRLHEVSDNVIFNERYETGDVDAAFREAAVGVERTFRSLRYSAAPMESRRVLVIPDDEGLIVWSSTQVPHILEESIVEVLGLEQRSLRAARTSEAASARGRACSRRGSSLPGRPCGSSGPSSGSRTAATTSSGPRTRASSWSRCTRQRTGTAGCSPSTRRSTRTRRLRHLPGPVRPHPLPAQHALGRHEQVPPGAHRGVGLRVAVIVHGRLMDVVAANLSLDRAEIRRRNLIPPEAFPCDTVSGLRYDRGRYGDALDLALSQIDYEAFPECQRQAREDARAPSNAPPGSGSFASVDDIGLVDGRQGLRGSPSASLSLAEAFEDANAGWLDVSDSYDPPVTAYPYATHVCSVEIEPATGALQIERYVVAEDCGPVSTPSWWRDRCTAPSPRDWRRPIRGAAVRRGRPDAHSELHGLPRADRVRAARARGPPSRDARAGASRRVQGGRQGRTLAPPAALANAVGDALGIEVDGFPISIKQTLAAVQSRRAEVSRRTVR